MDISWIWQSFADFITAQMVGWGFVWLCLEAFAVVAFFTLLGWYFSFMRGVAGVVFVAAVAFLTGVWHGEKTQASADKKKIDALRRKTEEQQGQGWPRW